MTSVEREMLDGKYGEGVALAMRVQVALGEAFDAERMVEIGRAHVALSNQEADLWFVEKLLQAGARCRVSPTVNPGFHLEYFLDKTDLTGQDMEMISRTRKAYRQIGATLSFSCTPYLMENIPRQGEIVAFSESSATPYVNAVWGARSNRESAQSALCAAVTGRVPLYGLLLPENRLGNILVRVEAEMGDDFDFRLLGYCAPKIGHGVPVFTGISGATPEALMNLGAELNTAGAYGMYHVVGITPEAPALEAALGGRAPLREVTISRRDLDEVRDSLSCPPGKIDFALFGCPHLTLHQVRHIARLLEGEQLKSPLWVMTSSTTRELARRTGLLSIIEKAGGYIVEDTCIDQPCWRFLEGKVGVTDSLKGAYYARRRGMSFVLRSITDCVRAAIKGEVE
nr:aconitase X catalytic domain-containing protein [Desulfofundulus thermobenzoicus]